jgi:hypothetical protein
MSTLDKSQKKLDKLKLEVKAEQKNIQDIKKRQSREAAAAAAKRKALAEGSGIFKTRRDWLKGVLGALKVTQIEKYYKFKLSETSYSRIKVDKVTGSVDINRGDRGICNLIHDPASLILDKIRMYV